MVAARQPQTGRFTHTGRAALLAGLVLLSVSGALVAARRLSGLPEQRMLHVPGPALSGVVVSSAPAASQPAPAAPARCADGMLMVEGIYCPYVGHRCVEWLQEKRDRCRRYDEKTILCEGLKVKKSFCMDRFEYPNQQGVYPVVMASWVDAEQACLAEGKRLCTESEWTFACEGEKMVPYPYGFERRPDACNIDRHYRDPDFSAFSHDRQISEEVSRLDQRVQSGSMSACVSPFGIHDMTGNVDEWVVNEDPAIDKGEDVSGLKGGYWGPIRARCRPVTNSHNRWFRFYQAGFRCCADPKP